jgi:hypothetical protein
LAAISAPTFAKLDGYLKTVSDGGFLLSQTWEQCSWVENSRQATKLSHDQAVQLVSELATQQPGPKYTIERDENGETNQPPYGLDNFVVRKS